MDIMIVVRSQKSVLPRIHSSPFLPVTESPHRRGVSFTAYRAGTPLRFFRPMECLKVDRIPEGELWQLIRCTRIFATTRITPPDAVIVG